MKNVKTEKLLKQCKEANISKEDMEFIVNVQKSVPIDGLCWQKGFRGVFHWKVLQWLNNWKSLTEEQKQEVERKAYEEEDKLARQIWEQILLSKTSPTVQIYMAERYAEKFLGLI